MTSNAANSAWWPSERHDTKEDRFAAIVAGRLVELAKVRPGMRVLDAGCDAGSVSVRISSTILPGRHVNRSDPANAPVETGSFDAILAAHVLPVLPEPSAALAAWRELLSSSGVLAFSWSAGQEDPRWAQVSSAVDAYLPQCSGLAIRAAPLVRPPTMRAALRHYGYVNIAIATETVAVHYATPQDWWLDSASPAAWTGWQHIPRDLLPAIRAKAIRMVEPLRETDGTLTQHIPVTYATASAATHQSAPGQWSTSACQN